MAEIFSLLIADVAQAERVDGDELRIGEHPQVGRVGLGDLAVPLDRVGADRQHGGVESAEVVDA